jgi:lysine biosynthesis protein LysW
MSKGRNIIKPIVASCKACHTRINFEERPELYDIVICPECDEEFEVVSLSPIRIDWPSDFMDDYQWSDDDDETPREW